VYHLTPDRLGIAYDDCVGVGERFVRQEGGMIPTDDDPGTVGARQDRAREPNR
jgi:hypothetical protein